MNKLKFKTIRWKDHSSKSSWLDLKELEEFATNPLICTTKGWVTYEDKNVIILSASFDGIDSYGENMCILKSCIVK